MARMLQNISAVSARRRPWNDLAAWSVRMIKRISGVVAALAVTACLATAAQPARAAELVKLKMAEVVRSQFYIPMYVALSKGFVKDEGLDVELITANGGDRAGALLLSGQTDFALAGP